MGWRRTRKRRCAGGDARIPHSTALDPNAGRRAGQRPGRRFPEFSGDHLGPPLPRPHRGRARGRPGAGLRALPADGGARGRPSRVGADPGRRPSGPRPGAPDDAVPGASAHMGLRGDRDHDGAAADRLRGECARGRALRRTTRRVRGHLGRRHRVGPALDRPAGDDPAEHAADRGSVERRAARTAATPRRRRERGSRYDDRPGGPGGGPALGRHQRGGPRRRRSRAPARRLDALGCSESPAHSARRRRPGGRSGGADHRQCGGRRRDAAR